MALLVANRPRQLDNPAELITNTINESLDAFGGRAGFRLQQFIERGALTAVTDQASLAAPSSSGATTAISSVTKYFANSELRGVRP